MNKVKILFTFLGTLVISVSSSAQFEEIKAGTTIDYNNVTMQKSPSAAAFGKVQEVSVNTATGVPNISIPLYTFEMDGVSVPISISYNASGIKVGDLATSVGLGWSLEAGGQFTRTVRAQADEFDGILAGSGLGPLSYNWYASYGTTMDIEEWQKDMRGNPYSLVDDGFARNADHYPDQFGYSFLGNSGSFIYNPNAAGIIKDKTDGIKILWDESITSDFGAKDMYGNSYEFFLSDTEKSNNMYTFGTEHDLVAGQAIIWEDDDGNTPPTAWKLSKITTKNNKVINFSYHSVDIDPYVIEKADSHITIGYACDSGPPAPPPVKNYGYTNITYNFNTQLIDTISSPNGNIIITFEYDTDTNITTPGVWLTKLEKIVVSDFTDNSKTKIKEFHFLYDRFTGGDPRLRLDELYEVVYDEYNNSIQKPSYKFSYNNGTLPPKDSFSQDFFGYFNNNYSGGYKKTLVPYLNPGEPFIQYFTDNSTNRDLNPSTIIYGMLTGIQYPIGGSTLFDYEPNELNGKYCGGLRIHKIENINSTEIYNKKTYEYSGLTGPSLNNRDLTRKIEGNTTSYYASFVAAAPEYKPGYFYDKVTVTSTDTKNSKSYREEHYYEENFDLQHKMDYALKQKMFFVENQPNPIKIEDYVNGIEENQFTVEWNILGDMKCYSPDVVNTSFNLGYNEYPRKLLHYGNSALLPKLIASTEYLGPSRKPVTTIKKIEYDPDTLLKTKEITDTRDTRIGFNDYGNRDESGEVLTTTYKYPSTAYGFPVDFPKGLLIKKEVSSNKSEETMIFGQAMEYDNVGNVIKTFQYNKGEVGNNSSLNYVDDYEEMSTIFYENGKPVQVFQKSGEATTYIWGLNNQYPVAKIEGKTRAALDQNLLAAVEIATYSALPGALDNLRLSLINDKAMLTTYTYKPLAGVETITDPKGEKITYHYDEFGRLDYVEDKDGNILSENEYHYRQQ